MVLKEIRGDSSQCWEEWWARVGRFRRNKKERLFCKSPHYPMLKRKNGLFAVSRPAGPSAAVGRLALHNIEESGGRTVSEVGERYFCKHRNGLFSVQKTSFPFFGIASRGHVWRPWISSLSSIVAVLMARFTVRRGRRRLGRKVSGALLSTLETPT